MNTMLFKFLPIVALFLSLTAKAGNGRMECEYIKSGLNCDGGATSFGGGGYYSTVQIVQKAEQAGRS